MVFTYRDTSNNLNQSMNGNDSSRSFDSAYSTNFLLQPLKLEVYASSIGFRRFLTCAFRQHMMISNGGNQLDRFILTLTALDQQQKKLRESDKTFSSTLTLNN